MSFTTHIRNQSPEELIVFCDGWKIDRIKCVENGGSRVFVPADTVECSFVQTADAGRLHCTTCHGEFSATERPEECPLCGARARREAR